MENFGLDKCDVENLVKELNQGREFAKQLQIHLDPQSSSNETHELLLHQIILSYDNVLSMLVPNYSDDSDSDIKDPTSRKRSKGESIWMEKVKVCTSTGVEGQLDDGYGWRKYGQKDILGAKYPRGYYRCTNRNGQGCLATKQVQRSDDDPTTFEITYRRKHTCNPRASPTHSGPIPMPDPHNKDPNPDPLTQSPQQLVPKSEQHTGPLFNIQTNLRVMPLDLGPNQNPSFDPFNFHASSAINFENNNILLDGNYNSLGNYSPNIISPASSGSGYFPINDNYGGLMPNLHALESELSPIVAVTTSATSSPTLGTNFGSGSSEFGSSFSFGNPGY